MKTIQETLELIDRDDYLKAFWNKMHGKPNSSDVIDSVHDAAGYLMPAYNEKKFREELEKHSVIRSIAKTVKLYAPGKLRAFDSNDKVGFVKENQTIPGFDVDNDFNDFIVGNYKFAGLFKVKESLVNDAAFDFTDYLTKRMAKSFGKAEDKIFIEGYGKDTDEPCGLEDDKYGAKIGVTTERVTYDDCLSLFYSVEPEYRKNATWLMNDKTALALRKLKDQTGNYLWNTADGTLLGRPVRICNELPDMSAGYKPIYFGDFDYYWIIDRAPFHVRLLDELFAEEGKVGYVGSEFLDAVLVRRDAIKTIAVSGVPDENYYPRD